MTLHRYISYEHPDNLYDPAAMTEAEYETDKGQEVIDESDAHVWQWANSREEAVSQHMDKYDERVADMAMGLPEKETY